MTKPKKKTPQQKLDLALETISLEVIALNKKADNDQELTPREIDALCEYTRTLLSATSQLRKQTTDESKEDNELSDTAIIEELRTIYPILVSTEHAIEKLHADETT